MNKKTKSVSEIGDSQASVKEQPKKVLKLGLDMHYRQVTVTMQEEQGQIKAVGRMGQEAFGHWVEKRRRKAGKFTAAMKPEPVATGCIGNWNDWGSRTWW